MLSLSAIRISGIRVAYLLTNNLKIKVMVLAKLFLFGVLTVVSIAIVLAVIETVAQFRQ
jgi:hypothetical protein